MSPASRAEITFRYERWRAICAGMLETAGATFLLLIAVKHFQAGPTPKAFVAAGSSMGLLLAPLVVSQVEHRQWRTTRAAAFLAAWGCAAFLMMAALPNLFTYVIGSMLAMASASAGVPLVTQMYQENYPEDERGRLFSRTVMIRIGTAAVFSEFAGRVLTSHPENFRLLLLIFAAAFAGVCFCLLRCPSQPLVQSHGSQPFKALRYAREDVLFRHTLIAWMLMGLGNLMMLPLRVEYLAGERHGLGLTVGEAAFLIGVVPNAARLIMSPVWGILFDRMNFFALRIAVNIGFALGILAFFTSNDIKGLIIGAIIYGISNAGGDVAWGLWVTKFAPPERVADYMSVHTFFTGVRGVIAPVLAFHLINHFQIRTIGVFCVGLIALSVVWLIPEARLGKKGRAGSALSEEVSE